MRRSEGIRPQGVVYVVGDRRTRASLVACCRNRGRVGMWGVFCGDVRVVLVAAAIADRAGGEIDGDGMGAAAGAGKVVGGAGECEGERVRGGGGGGGGRQMTAYLDAIDPATWARAIAYVAMLWQMFFFQYIAKIK